ncbi:hypothetical protein AV274_5707 [Blastocystis sp. ATCC 50177/Nand II]|uniref:Uncharacterized protein n=1 Tax=Blastocystis sp. subtype 1 (strain ATCC 50177 / NandII) TaxID=478820 RepID=A0A196S6B8_BLAHN|nr:hypothetical protein AV274_5707 [Blastocystis sp. ATCC 50177/Nand II]
MDSDEEGRLMDTFPEKVVGQQIKEKTQTNAVSKKTSVYLSAVMEGIAKYVLTMAGEGKEEYMMPENRCIRVDDVEKVLMSVGVPSAESDVGSRDFLNGASICVDSISSTLLNDTIQLITIYFQEFVPIQTLSVTLSPHLQEYLFHQADFDDGFMIATYCERVSTALQIQQNARQLLLIPRSLRLLLAVSTARGRQKQQSLLLLRNYLNAFDASTAATLDVLVDCDDNTKYYREYNAYRRESAKEGRTGCAGCASFAGFAGPLLKLETEQFVFYKVVRDVLRGRWVVTVPRYCRLESWEVEQMLKVATGRAKGFRRCEARLAFGESAPKREGVVVYAEGSSVVNRFRQMKKEAYVSPWSEEECGEKNREVWCNLGLLCLCPIELIPVVYHHLYYQCSIVFYSSLPEDHLSLRNILSLIRGNLGVITSSDSYTKMDLCFDDFALKLEYGYDERYPNRVEQVVENGQEAFEGKKKKRMGLTSDNLQKFYTQPLDEVVAMLS